MIKKQRTPTEVIRRFASTERALSKARKTDRYRAEKAVGNHIEIHVETDLHPTTAEQIIREYRHAVLRL